MLHYGLPTVDSSVIAGPRVTGCPPGWSVRALVLAHTPDDRASWGGMWADRMLSSAIATQAVPQGHATSDDLRRIADGWREWVADPDGWFAVLHGELLATC